MFDRVLIANRGEIALRIIRACKEMGIETVAVYSQADETSLPAQLADHSVCIGPAPSTDSYLLIEQIISDVNVTIGNDVQIGSKNKQNGTNVTVLGWNNYFPDKMVIGGDCTIYPNIDLTKSARKIQSGEVVR